MGKFRIKHYDVPCILEFEHLNQQYPCNFVCKKSDQFLVETIIDKYTNTFKVFYIDPEESVKNTG